MKSKITLLAIAFAVTGLAASAQTDTTSNELGKKIIKVSLTSLPLRTINVQFERAIAKKISFAIAARYMPSGSLPLKSSIKSLIDDQDINKQIDQFETGNVAITPEVRFYLSKKALKGFYIAPFASYANYSASVPFEFDVPNSTGTGSVKETIPLSGNLNTFTGGIMFGAQFKLSKHLALDWWILGPQYGGSSGNIAGSRSLTTQEQQALRDELNELEDLPLVKTTYTVDANGARVDFKGPLAGVRAGICLGYRF